MAEITEAYLLNLFNTEKLDEIIIGQAVPEGAHAGTTTPAPKRHKGDDSSGAASGAASVVPSTPMTLALLNMVTPGPSRERLRQDLKKDNDAIRRIEELQDIDDPLYTFFNSNSGIGLYLELWVCANITCPGCGEDHQLYKYNKKTMPVIDVRCINPEHRIGPKYYQIKATEKGVRHNGLLYFTLEENYICVGSRRYGERCHLINGSSRRKKLLIGYICIEYKKKDDNNIIIDKNTSFILVPDLTNIMDANYYNYKESRTDKIERITFNTDMMIKPLTFQDRFPTLDNNVSLNITYEMIPIDIQRGGSYIKYLIMKMKYLNLKKNIKYININGIYLS